MTGTCPRPLAGFGRWLLLAVLALGLATNASAQDRPRRDAARNGGAAVLRAFKPVVADVAKSTVRVVATNGAEGRSPRELSLGVIVSPDGLILTKSSELSKEVSCRLGDGRLLAAERVATDADLDLALLKIDASNLSAISWASVEPEVGQWLATASTGDLPTAVGVVSVKPRSIPRERAALGVTVAEAEKGVRISEVSAGSSALKAGLKSGDVIFEVAGKAVLSPSELRERITSFRIGDPVVVKIRRAEETLDVEAVLGHALPESNRSAFQNALGGELSLRRDGFASAIQHDTVLRPEDCGGPIVGLDGKAIGLNIARAGRTESYAIPASLLIPAIDTMKRGASMRVQKSE
jgi:serine protease Do